MRRNAVHSPCTAGTGLHSRHRHCTAATAGITKPLTQAPPSPLPTPSIAAITNAAIFLKDGGRLLEAGPLFSEALAGRRALHGGGAR